MSPRDPPARGLTRGAWRAQRMRCKQRGIEFRFTYEEWLDWWQKALAEQGPGAQRGQGRGLFVMCRFGDQGAYEPGNIYCGTQRDNCADIPPEKRRHDHYWLRGRTGADHPQSKPIETPSGRFPSIRLAAQHYGMTANRLKRCLADGRLSASAT